MATDTLVDSRVVSGRGLLLYPPEGRNRYLMIYADLVRPPTSPYYNTNYNPARSRYATLTFLRDGYVMREEAMEFDRQIFTDINDITGQNLNAIKCAYAGILASFANLGTAQGLIVTQVTDQIRNYESLRLNWDECRIVCHADTAISVQLYSLRYDVCLSIYDKDHPPPPPPTVPPRVAPGVAVNISPPYVPGGNDDNRTVPNPIDNSLFPPGSTPGDYYNVLIEGILFTGRVDTVTLTVRAPWSSPYISGTYKDEIRFKHSGFVGQTYSTLGYDVVAISAAPGINPPSGGLYGSCRIVSYTHV